MIKTESDETGSAQNGSDQNRNDQNRTDQNGTHLDLKGILKNFARNVVKNQNPGGTPFNILDFSAQSFAIYQFQI